MKHKRLLLMYLVAGVSFILLIVNIVDFYNEGVELKSFFMRVTLSVLIIISMLLSVWEFKKRLKKEENE